MTGYFLPKKIEPYYEAIALLIIFMITFIAYLIPAVKIMPRADELDYLTHAENLLKGKITISPQRGYFFSVVLAVALFLFGNKLIVAQTTSVLLGALIVFPTYLFTRELFRKKPYNRLLGFMSVMMFSWINFKYSVEIRNDALFIFLYLFSCYFGIRGVREPRYLKFAGLFLGLSYFTRDPGILLLPVLVLYFLLNSNSRTKLGLTNRFRFLFDKNLLIMFAFFLFSTIPKFLLRWNIYGHPLYVQHSYSYFWIDDYNDKYFIYLNTIQASMTTYLRTHTIPQMAERWISGAQTLIKQLAWGISWPLLGSDIFSIILAILSVIGLILLAKKEYSILHLNLSFWFIFFAWLYDIRATTRWIIPMYVFLAIASMYVVINLAILMGQLLDRIIRSSSLIYHSRFSLQTPPLLLTIYYKTKKRLRNLTVWEKNIPLILICVLFASFLGGMIIRAEQGFYLKRTDKSYYELREMADWVITNTPEDAFFMSEQEDIITYYGKRKAMFIPPSSLDFILQTISEQNIDYLVIDTDTLHDRSSLKPIFEGEILPQGFNLVYKNYEGDPSEENGFKIQIYAINQMA